MNKMEQNDSNEYVKVDVTLFFDGNDFDLDEFTEYYIKESLKQNGFISKGVSISNIRIERLTKGIM